MQADRIWRLGAALALCATATSPAYSKDEDRKPQVYVDLKQCQAIADPGQRLACYDTAAGALITSTESGEIRLVDQEEARQVRRSLFGFSLPRIGLFGGGKERIEEEEVKVLETTVTRVRRLQHGKYLFTIAEGDAQWQTTDAPMMMRTPKAGQKVTLERAALGSYWVKFEGQRPVKGKRVN
jgi:hypothetical protein